MSRVSHSRSRIAHTMIGLTPKQAKFVESYIHEPNATQSAIQAGYSDKTAYAIGYENLNKPQVKSAIISILEQQGCTDTHLSRRIYESTNAEKVVSSYTEGDSIQPDHAIRLKGVELALRLKGLLDRSSDTTSPSVTINSDKIMILLQSSMTPSTTSTPTTIDTNVSPGNTPGGRKNEK
jgi:hypothetical protein